MAIQTLSRQAVLALLLVFEVGGCAMAEPGRENVVELKWEWPGDRKPEDRMIVRLAKVTEETPRQFDVRQSPSLAASLPEAVVLDGMVTGGSKEWEGKSVRLRLPRPEVGDLRAGDRVALAVTSGPICIYADKVPQGIPEDQIEEWLSAWPPEARER